MKRQQQQIKLKRTSYILLAVGIIFGGIVLAGGGRLYRWLTAPRIDPQATPLPPTATALPSPTATPRPAGWQEQRDARSGTAYLTPPPAEEQALRAAFAVLFSALAWRRTAKQRSGPTTARRAPRRGLRGGLHLALAGHLVFVHALGPENAIAVTIRRTVR